MPILACGINHKTAPVALRERVFFAPEKCALYLRDLMLNENITEAVLLSTCNRSELYCDASDTDKILDWFCRQHRVLREELEPAMYFYRGEDAVSHLMSVACGLDSLAVGESQILSQLKEAFGESCAAGSVSATFHRLFQQVFSVTKEVRTNTAIGACPVSVASAAVRFVKERCSEHLNRSTVLVIGAGVTVDLVLRHLKTTPPQRILIANRSEENAAALKERYDVDVISFSKLAFALKTADIVISATGSPIPVVTKTMISSREKPLWIVDIAVPRDIEPEVAECENVFLYSIDDLKTIIQQNLIHREHAAEKARDRIKQKSAEFMTWLNSFDKVATTISAYRKQVEDFCRAELAKAAKHLQRGDDPLQVLAVFSHALTNKLLHAPSVQLRQAGVEGRLEILELARELLAIPEPQSELL